MDIIRQDTDYAMRALVHLGLHRGGEPISAKVLANKEDIPEDFAYKLLRHLAKAGLVESHMGIQGGFSLARDPENILFLEVVQAVQGPVTVRKCILGKSEACPRYDTCPVSAKLSDLQETVTEFMSKLTLAKVLEAVDS